MARFRHAALPFESSFSLFRHRDHFILTLGSRLFLFSLLMLGVAAAGSVVRVEDSSPLVTYAPDVIGDGPTLCQGKPGVQVCLNHWWVQQSPNDDDTTHWTCGLGNSISFTFQGVSIAWYGGIGYFPKTIANVSIDNGPVEQADQGASGLFYRQQIYSKSGLDPSTTHTIRIVFAGPVAAPKVNATCMNLDYFEYISFDTNNPPITSAPSGTSSPDPNPSSSTSSTPITTANLSGTNVGLIVGCALGAFSAVVVLVVAFLYYFQRRRNQKRINVVERGDPATVDLAAMVYEPFVLDPSAIQEQRQRRDSRPVLPPPSPSFAGSTVKKEIMTVEPITITRPASSSKALSIPPGYTP